jgi:hypothetical protein
MEFYIEKLNLAYNKMQDMSKEIIKRRFDFTNLFLISL